MGIRGLPTTYEGYLQLLLAYERERFAFDPANTRVAEASLRIAAATTPGRAAARRTPGGDLADGRAAARGPRPAPAAGLAGPRRTPGPAAAGRRAAVRPPRTEPKPYASTTYPHGYTLADLGPRAMLAHLNAHPSDAADSQL